MIAAHPEPDRPKGKELTKQWIASVSHRFPAALVCQRTLGIPRIRTSAPQTLTATSEQVPGSARSYQRRCIRWHVMPALSVLAGERAGLGGGTRAPRPCVVAARSLRLHDSRQRTVVVVRQWGAEVSTRCPPVGNSRCPLTGQAAAEVTELLGTAPLDADHQTQGT
jgi:hypothetical protein